jgi:hypothetical protein
MGIYIVPQPEPGERPPYISGPSRRNIVFVRYDHTVTAQEAGEFEMWFPYVNGHPEKHHVMVHKATVVLSKNLSRPRKARVMIQSEDGTARVLIQHIDWREGMHSVSCPFLGIHGSRGILYLNEAPVGLEITATYLLELI